MGSRADVDISVGRLERVKHCRAKVLSIALNMLENNLNINCLEILDNDKENVRKTKRVFFFGNINLNKKPAGASKYAQMKSESLEYVFLCLSSNISYRELYEHTSSCSCLGIPSPEIEFLLLAFAFVFNVSTGEQEISRNLTTSGGPPSLDPYQYFEINSIDSESLSLSLSHALCASNLLRENK